jgi:hypothetical protein
MPQTPVSYFLIPFEYALASVLLAFSNLSIPLSPGIGSASALLSAISYMVASRTVMRERNSLGGADNLSDLPQTNGRSWRNERQNWNVPLQALEQLRQTERKGARQTVEAPWRLRAFCMFRIRDSIQPS